MYIRKNIFYIKSILEIRKICRYLLYNYINMYKKMFANNLLISLLKQRVKYDNFLKFEYFSTYIELKVTNIC